MDVNDEMKFLIKLKKKIGGGGGGGGGRWGSGWGFRVDVIREVFVTIQENKIWVESGRGWGGGIRADVNGEVK